MGARANREFQASRRMGTAMPRSDVISRVAHCDHGKRDRLFYPFEDDEAGGEL